VYCMVCEHKQEGAGMSCIPINAKEKGAMCFAFPFSFLG